MGYRTWQNVQSKIFILSRSCSSSILERHLEKIVVLENNDLSANQNAPQFDDTIWITLVRRAISMLCIAEKMRVRNSLSKLYKVTTFSNLLLGLIHGSLYRFP